MKLIREFEGRIERTVEVEIPHFPRSNKRLEVYGSDLEIRFSRIESES
jgi:hypothetical protein